MTVRTVERPLAVEQRPRTGRRRQRPLAGLFQAAVTPRVILIGMCVLYVVPFYWMATTALKDNPELNIYPPTLWPQAPNPGNFVSAVRYIPFPQFFLNSVILTAGTAIGAGISNPLIAYGFARIKWPGRDVMFAIVMATIFVPFPVLILGLFDVFTKLGWIDTFLPLIVPAFFGNPFYIFLMRQFLLQLPIEISDSARIDGARELQIFWHIILPLAKPAVAVVIIFAAVAAWNEFLLPLIYLQDESRYPLAIGLQFFRSQHNVQYNLLMAASTLVVLPVLGLFLAFQKFFIEGVSVGAVKG